MKWSYHDWDESMYLSGYNLPFQNSYESTGWSYRGWTESMYLTGYNLLLQNMQDPSNMVSDIRM